MFNGRGNTHTHKREYDYFVMLTLLDTSKVNMDTSKYIHHTQVKSRAYSVVHRLTDYILLLILVYAKCKHWNSWYRYKQVHLTHTQVKWWKSHGRYE